MEPATALSSAPAVAPAPAPALAEFIDDYTEGILQPNETFNKYNLIKMAPEDYPKFIKNFAPGYDICDVYAVKNETQEAIHNEEMFRIMREYQCSPNCKMLFTNNYIKPGEIRQQLNDGFITPENGFRLSPNMNLADEMCGEKGDHRKMRVMFLCDVVLGKEYSDSMLSYPQFSEFILTQLRCNSVVSISRKDRNYIVLNPKQIHIKCIFKYRPKNEYIDRINYFISPQYYEDEDERKHRSILFVNKITRMILTKLLLESFKIKNVEALTVIAEYINRRICPMVFRSKIRAKLPNIRSILNEEEYKVLDDGKLIIIEGFPTTSADFNRKSNSDIRNTTVETIHPVLLCFQIIRMKY
jgi:hypothetical protein